MTYSHFCGNLIALNALMGSFDAFTASESVRLVRARADGFNCRPGAGCVNSVAQHGYARYSVSSARYSGIQVVPRKVIFALSCLAQGFLF